MLGVVVRWSLFVFVFSVWDFNYGFHSHIVYIFIANRKVSCFLLRKKVIPNTFFHRFTRKFCWFSLFYIQSLNIVFIIMTRCFIANIFSPMNWIVILKYSLEYACIMFSVRLFTSKNKFYYPHKWQWRKLTQSGTSFNITIINYKKRNQDFREVFFFFLFRLFISYHNCAIHPEYIRNFRHWHAVFHISFSAPFASFFVILKNENNYKTSSTRCVWLESMGNYVPGKVREKKTSPTIAFQSSWNNRMNILRRLLGPFVMELQMKVFFLMIFFFFENSIQLFMKISAGWISLFYESLHSKRFWKWKHFALNWLWAAVIFRCFRHVHIFYVLLITTLSNNL